MSDLFESELTQEQRWSLEIKECQIRVQMRVEQAIATRSKVKRKDLYKSWRQVYGDDIARESAKLAELILTGASPRPKWFEKKYQVY